ncbi:flagellar filament capping protein FliD, partial [Alcaligenes faecalis]|uniref:flagellar filament capping protein FliD n=1 Tax=Alcaligenes faecalis TaxID=511 RepID=UPI001E3B51B0
NPAASGFEQTKALNAKLTVNGIAITSQSNTLKDTIEGLEITLNKAGDEPVNVEVAKDDSVA